MNSSVAGQLLSKVMNWDDATLAGEAPWLLFMASMKYDSYDQYMPGTRFMASLVQWLGQFETIEERQKAYEMVKEKLIFISSTQVTYLVKLLYTTKIKQDIFSQVAEKLGEKQYLVKRIENSSEYKMSTRRSLIVGLSDGAHIDVLRRTAGFNNDQVLTNYYPSEDKAQDMIDELAKDEYMRDVNDPKFGTLYLIDDFTASGTSFIRIEGDEYKGKICKVLGDLDAEGSAFNVMFRPKSLIRIRLLFCIATEYALRYIEEAVNSYLREKDLLGRFDIRIDAVQTINDTISSKVMSDTELMRIAENYFRDSAEVMTKSYCKGKHDFPYLGYNEGALPIILSHNTPNNSLPLLWQYTANFKGLFPRVNRHIQ